MTREIVVDASDRLADIALLRLERLAAAAIDRRGSFALALPGGSVAEALLPRLASRRLDLARTDFFWTDERAVPPDDPESNCGRARRLFLAPAGVAPERVHAFAPESDAPQALEAAAAAGEAELVRTLGATTRLDLVILGVGADGHVASLFPEHALLREPRRWVAALDDAPKPPRGRVTLTLPAIAAARQVLVMAFGAEKAAAIEEACDDPVSRLPLALVLRRAEATLLLLDRAAASRVTGGPPGAPAP